MPESTKVKQEAPDVMPAMSDDDMMPADLVMADDPDEIRVDDATVAASRHKLTNTLTFSFPGGSLKSALTGIKTDLNEPLSQSCFSQIRLDRGPPDFEDDELTNLDWLQDKHLARKIGGNQRLCPSPPSSDDGMSDLEYDSGKENSSLNSSFTNSPMPHPTHIPYNPQKHINSKPPYSFSCLIFMAIEDCPEKKLPVKDIYSWIVSNFPYFQRAPTGWKNSVRHNLSLNKCFRKVDKDKSSNVGKGSYWCIDPNYRPNLLQALRKTPYHPYHQLQMMSSPSSTQSTTNIYSPYSMKFGSPSNISPHLFPLLSKRLSDQNSRSLDSDIDVANALVSLKKSANERSLRKRRMRALRLGRRSPSPPEFGSTADKERTTHRSRRAHSHIIVTEAPSADHSYSSHSVPRALQHIQMSSDDSSSIDEEFEFTSGDEFDSDEEMHLERDNKKVPVIGAGKEMEGVNALLNLASIATQVMSDVVGDNPSNNKPLPNAPRTRTKK